MKPTDPITALPLGTPLSPAATRVMLLGSGELGKEVLIALQRLGVETIAVDRYEHAPGQQVAHHARTITMSDPDQLRALIEAERTPVANTCDSAVRQTAAMMMATITSTSVKPAAPTGLSGMRGVMWLLMPHRWLPVR